MERLYGTDNILMRGRLIKFVLISPRADFSLGRHFNVTPADVCTQYLRAARLGIIGLGLRCVRGWVADGRLLFAACVFAVSRLYLRSIARVGDE